MQTRNSGIFADRRERECISACLVPTLPKDIFFRTRNLSFFLVRHKRIKRGLSGRIQDFASRCLLFSAPHSFHGDDKKKRLPGFPKTAARTDAALSTKDFTLPCRADTLFCGQMRREKARLENSATEAIMKAARHFLQFLRRPGNPDAEAAPFSFRFLSPLATAGFFLEF